MSDIVMKSNENECRDIRLARNCPNCNNLIKYKNKYRLEYAIRDGTWCSKCWRNKRKNTKFSEWSKQCPLCNNLVYFKTKYCLQRSIKTNAVCHSCADRGNIGRIQSYGEKECRAVRLRGQIRSLKSRKLYSESKRGRKNPQFGNHTSKSTEHRRKIRLGCIKTIEERLKLVGKTMSPAFNPIACEIIDKYGKQNGYNFQHALNGGEYYISDLGYWVDGYDKERNIVIEFYEREHGRTSRQEKDKKREIEIIDVLKCQFIIIHENGEIERVH